MNFSSLRRSKQTRISKGYTRISKAAISFPVRSATSFHRKITQ
ncbi:MAG: hypothetical protein GF401_03000 [Chitinivibrionales bacterium]|nr:hypothetical protein [Chitinivibrionales bacterium]